MESYIALKHSHTLLAFLSVLGFGLKGHMVLVMNRATIHPVLRIGPHVVNGLLIILGLWMWHLAKLPLQGWFGLKMIFVLTYFANDGLAFARAKQGKRHQGVVFYVFGLLAFLMAAWLAVSKPALF